MTATGDPRCGTSRQQVQRDVVDDPVHAASHADALVVDVMRTRVTPRTTPVGARTTSPSPTPMSCSATVTRAVKEATEHGPVDTERQRHAVTSYRALADPLPDQPAHREEHTR